MVHNPGWVSTEGERLMEQQLEEIRQRLERAEHQLGVCRTQSRRWRWVAGLALVAIFAFFAAQPTARQAQAAQALSRRPVTEIRAPLTVLDDRGRPILQVGAHAFGRGLLLYDAAGKVVCGIGVSPQGRGVAVFDAQEKMVAGLGDGRSTDGVGTGRGLTVFDPAEKIVGTLGMGSNGVNRGRGLSVNDESGTQVVGLGVWPQRPDRGQLVISDRSNNILLAQPSLP